MGKSPDKRCALDVNVLLDLANGESFAWDFLEIAKEKHCPIFISPTAFIELEYLAENGHLKQKAAAVKAMSSLITWGVTLFNIPPLEHGFAEEIARNLIRKGYLDEAEYHDGLILAECAQYKVPILITSDHHLLDLPYQVLRDELHHHSMVTPVPPWKIVQIASR